MIRDDISLRGREEELARLMHLASGLREGSSEALVVRGEPGVGKTALLKQLIGADTGCRVEHSVGIESEIELAFAGLHQLCAPMLGYLGRLPEAHRDAVQSAFGPGGTVPDRFFLGLAILEMLTEVAEARPLLCVIDDSQWLDRSTAQVLGFVARRLRCEAIGFVLVVREPRQEFAGLPELVLHGLPELHARAVLDDAIHRPLDPRVRDRIVAETRGNPLALLELAGEYSRNLAGGFAIPDSDKLSGRLEDSFLRHASRMPADMQRSLLLAAADPLGDPVLLGRAAAHLSLPFGPELTAATHGLLEYGARVRFRHPLVRSAVYGAASDPERREVHRALGLATDPERDPDRRIWHFAQAAEGNDEGIADELERSAGRARDRGGLAAVAAFLVRSAALTADPANRGRRILEAALAEHKSGAPEMAEGHVAAAQAGVLSEFDRARAELLRARITFDRTRGRDAPWLLLSAARQLEPFDGNLSRDAYLEAVLAGSYVGTLEAEAQQVAAQVPRAFASAASSTPVELVLGGWSRLLSNDFAAGAPLVRRAIDVLGQQATISPEDLPAALAAFSACAHTWDLAGWTVLTDCVIPAAREAGALPLLSLLLVAAGSSYLQRGNFLQAEAVFEESISIALDIGLPPQGSQRVIIHSWRGRYEQTLALVDDVRRQTRSRGEGSGEILVELALLRLYNGYGQYDAAVAAAPGWTGRSFHKFGSLSCPEMIEAAVGCGQIDLARHTLAMMTETTQASATDWGLGEEVLARAQLNETAAAGDRYRYAIAHLERCGASWRAARAHLLYGEWLRRQGERADARAELHTAHSVLSEMHAHAFAERAARELKATGAISRRRSHDARDDLTPQERQIAQMAADGLTNREIGRRLYLSHRTIGSHLYRIYPKLGVGARSELGPTLRDGAEGAEGAGDPGLGVPGRSKGGPSPDVAPSKRVTA